MYASPRNACQSVQPAPEVNSTDVEVFAFIEEYTTCSGTSVSYYLWRGTMLEGARHSDKLLAVV